jgi:hypothetical protein
LLADADVPVAISTSRTSRWRARWAVVLVAACALAVPAALGSGARAATGPDPVLATSTTVAATDPVPLAATASPCHPASASGPCTIGPSQILVTAASGQTPTALEVKWVAEAAPAPNPSPSTTAVIATRCSSPAAGVTCWPWPVSLERSGLVLNGTYQVVACGAGSTTGTCSPDPSYNPATIEVAAPPTPPSSARATYNPAGITVTWTAPSSSFPQLVGYQITRSGHVIDSCSTVAGGPVSAPTCPSPLAFVDHPGPGSYTYTVSALGYGTTASPAALVRSAPATAAVVVPTPQETETSAPPQISQPSQETAIATGPVVSVAPTGATSQAPVTTTTLGASGVASPPTTTPSDQALPYTGTSKPSSQGVASGTPTENGPKNPDLDTWAALALALIILAVVAHLWYLRREVGAYRAQHRLRHGTR